MKQINLIIVTLLIGQFIQAQSVGIGTTTPNASAALDIRSTTKGLLIPSMTTLQRFAIPSPFNGLMVYDTDKNEYYHYNGSGWKVILNGEYWSRPITSRDRIANTTDSIGIGTSSPSERLDVNGNIRSRNNLLADNNMTATGTITGGLLISTGNLVTLGTSSLSGNVTTYSDLIVDNATATLQLKSSNVNKGFFQLSGDNVRFGTNSGNSSGNLVMRMNGTDRVFVSPTGNVGIGDASPTHKLDVSGDINLTGDIMRTSLTGTASLLPLCYGFIGSSGNIIFGTGNFTVQHPGIGVYQININGVNISNTAMFVTPYTHFSAAAGPDDGIPNILPVYVEDFAGNSRNGAFYFIVYRL